MYDYRELVREYRTGLSAPQVAKKHGCGKSTVYHALSLYGVSSRTTRYHTKKLDPIQLHRDYEAGLTLTELAEIHGTTPRTIRNHLLRSGYRTRSRKEAASTLKKRIKVSARTRRIPLTAWDGFVTRKRNTLDYQRWRTAIIQRDGSCLFCGGDQYLQAHHIETLANAPERMLDSANGVTLCKACHEGIKSKESLYAHYFRHRLRGA